MEIFNTYPFLIPFISVIVTEILKFIFDSIHHKKLTLKNFFHSGGMPSAHSSLSGAILMCTFLYTGVQSIEFAIAATFALIVMYDAMNIRMKAGYHAEVLNVIQKKVLTKKQCKELDERLGHTFTQVIAGFAVGCLIAYVLLLA